MTETVSTRSSRNRRVVALMGWGCLVVTAFFLWNARQTGSVRSAAAEPVAFILAAFAAFVGVFAWMLFNPGRRSAAESPSLFFAAVATLFPPPIIGFCLMPIDSPLRGWLALGLFLLCVIAVLSHVPDEFFGVPRGRHTYLTPIPAFDRVEGTVLDPNASWFRFEDLSHIVSNTERPSLAPRAYLQRDIQRTSSTTRTERRPVSEVDDILGADFDLGLLDDPTIDDKPSQRTNPTPPSSARQTSPTSVSAKRHGDRNELRQRVTVGEPREESIREDSRFRHSSQLTQQQPPLHTTSHELPELQTHREKTHRENTDHARTEDRRQSRYSETRQQEERSPQRSHDSTREPVPSDRRSESATGTNSVSIDPVAPVQGFLESPRPTAQQLVGDAVPRGRVESHDASRTETDHFAGRTPYDGTLRHDSGEPQADHRSTPQESTRSRAPTQQNRTFQRSTDEAGSELVEGVMQVHFVPGQKRANIHVPFSPPLPGIPDVECECVGGESLRLKVPVRQSYGIRIEARRSNADQPLDADIGFAAVYTPE